MKNVVILVFVVLASLLPGARGAISVGPNGSGTIRFEVRPGPGEWSTITNAGGSGDFPTEAALDVAIQTNVASGLRFSVGGTATTAPAVSFANIPRWNQSYQLLQTVAAGSSYLSLLATLRNDTGTDQSALTVGYQLFEDFVTDTTVTEEVPGHRVFFSLTGETNSWQLVPSLSSMDESGLSATLNLGTWQNGELLYILWVDDNAAAGRSITNTTVNTEGGYLIDNVTFKPGATNSAISVGLGGTTSFAFDEFPTIVDGWYTGFHIAGDITDAAGLDAAVQANALADFFYQLLDSVVVSPSLGASQIGRWNFVDHIIQTVPTGVSYVSVLAVLRNDTGADQTALSITYDLGQRNAPGTTVVEQVSGHRVYFSLSGEPNTWQVIPELSSVGTPGALAAVLNLGLWANGSPLYLLWADDNATANRDNSGDEEGGYTIDNVRFFPGSVSGVTIVNPTEGRSIPEGAPIPINVVALMPGNVIGVDFYVDGNLLDNDPVAPFSLIYSNAALGPHVLTATGVDDLGNVVDAMPVNITVVPNTPPVVRFTEPADGANFFVGVNVTNRVTATDADGRIARVEFYVDGSLVFTDMLAPYVLEMCNVTAGPHTISALAADDGNFLGTNSITVTATNPPNITALIPNGSSWRYLDDGSDQGFVWILGFFDDTGWGEGAAELGYGDAANSRPERTVVGFGPDPAAKFPTTYFRKSFSVEDPSAYSNLVLRLLRDDSAVVYINATEVFRSNLTNETVTFATYSGLIAADDGTVYQVTDIDPSILLPGDNVVAVELHQDGGTSSDISFDLMLWAQPGGPGLTITRLSETQADVSWPFPSPGYIIESKASLDAVSWSAVTELDVPDGSFHHVTVDLASATKFFRLRKP